MKRRAFVKTASTAAILPVISGEIATGAGPAEQPDNGASGQSKGYSVDGNANQDAGAYEHIHCDQFGIDFEGNPITDGLTGTGSDSGLKKHDPDNPHKMTLTQEEQDILDGSKGPVMAKVLKTVIMHGELFGAERLADCGGAPHSSL